METRKGKGVFVYPGAERLTKAQRLSLITPKLDTLLRDAERLGLTEEDLRELLARRTKAAQKSDPRKPEKSEESIWVRPS